MDQEEETPANDTHHFPFCQKEEEDKGEKMATTVSLWQEGLTSQPKPHIRWLSILLMTLIVSLRVSLGVSDRVQIILETQSFIFFS